RQPGRNTRHLEARGLYREPERLGVFTRSSLEINSDVTGREYGCRHAHKGSNGGVHANHGGTDMQHARYRGRAGAVALVVPSVFGVARLTHADTAASIACRG